jgi:hypothetical protein
MFSSVSRPPLGGSPETGTSSHPAPLPPFTVAVQQLSCPPSLHQTPLLFLMPRLRNGADIISCDDETGSTTNFDTDNLFDDSSSETNATSDTETASRQTEIDSDTDDDASLFEDEIRHSPGHYRTTVANINVQPEDSEAA